MELTPCRASKAEQVLDALKSAARDSPMPSSSARWCCPRPCRRAGSSCCAMVIRANPRRRSAASGAPTASTVVQIEVYVEEGDGAVGDAASTTSFGR